jgi:hypothetical protein
MGKRQSHWLTAWWPWRVGGRGGRNPRRKAGALPLRLEALETRLVPTQSRSLADQQLVIDFAAMDRETDGDLAAIGQRLASGLIGRHT